MWTEHSEGFWGGGRSSLSLGRVINELIADDEGFDPSGDDVAGDPVFASAPAADFIARCDSRTYQHTRLGPSQEAEEAVLGALAARGRVRRAFREDDDFDERDFYGPSEHETEHAALFDAQALVLLAGEMAFRTYPGKHAFFDPDSEPSQARTAAQAAECEWVWATLADIYGRRGLDGALLRGTAASWPGTWQELLDHVGRLQQP